MVLDEYLCLIKRVVQRPVRTVSITSNLKGKKWEVYMLVNFTYFKWNQFSITSQIVPLYFPNILLPQSNVLKVGLF